MNIKQIFNISLLITAIVLAFYSGIRYQQQQSLDRTIELLQNDEIPFDKIALSVIDYIVYNRTNMELFQEVEPYIQLKE